MVEHELLPAEGILIVRPKGRLEAGDFENLAREVDPYIEAKGTLHGLMIAAGSFPGWKDFAAGLGNVERVDVLPFHQLGRFKWERLGMEYQLKDATPPSPETVGRVVERFRAAGLKTV